MLDNRVVIDAFDLHFSDARIAAALRVGVDLRIVSTSYPVGSALGPAAITAVATSQGADRLGDATALTDGYSGAFVGAAAIAVVGVLVAAALMHTAKPAAAADATSDVEAAEPIAA